MERQAAGGEEQQVRVSVVTPTYNRRDSLLSTLRALAKQTLAPSSFEALVISDGSTDGTAQACKQLAVPYTLRYFEQDHQGPAAARNLGVREARGEIIVFLDDDVVPDPELLSVYLALHERHPRAVGIGPLLPPADMRLQPWVRWEEEKLLKQYADMTAGKWEPTYRQFYTGNAAVRRQDILEMGGFDARFRRAEDVELALRMSDRGFVFHFLPEARGWHYARRTFRSWFDIPRAYAHADILMASEPGQDWILGLAGHDFHTRQPLLKKLATRYIAHPRRYGAMVYACATMARVLAAVPLNVSEKLSSGLYSLVFNLRYWQTLANELGVENFWAIVAKNAPPDAVTEDQPSQVPSAK